MTDISGFPAPARHRPGKSPEEWNPSGAALACGPGAGGPVLGSLMLHQQAAAQQILQCIEEGTYCALLGPHFSGKTLLVRCVEQQVMHHWHWPCVYVDLSRLEASTQRGFFASLAGLASQRIGEQTGLILDAPELTVISGAAFRGFLADVVAEMQHDVVLLIDQLEALPTDLVQALLTSLRAAYMEQHTNEHRLMVVASGALSLTALAMGESSPFRGIARRVFVGDLSERESEALIDEQVASEQVRISDAGRRRLLHATQGDPYLIKRMCLDATQAARETASAQVTARTVGQVVRRFLAGDVAHYVPLQEAVRTVEGDPDLLRCVLLLLERGAVPRAELPLPLSPDVDPLYLTGVVQKVDGDRYRLRYDIYHRFLAHHFDPGRVGHLLTMAGQWDAAIDSLQASIRQGDQEFRSDLLLATVHSMYASEDLNQAAHFLLRGLSAAFDVKEAQVWMASQHENSLRLVGPASSRHASAVQGVGPGESPVIALHEDCLEARAFREGHILRGHEGVHGVVRAIPLLTEGRRPIGVVTLSDWLGDRFAEQREHELQLMGYLHQAARALQQVSQRTRELALAGRMQAGFLPPAPEPAGWQLAAVLQPARVMAGDFYDFVTLSGGRLGIVIADVADKGLGAALYMALCRTLIRTFATGHQDEPAHVLSMTSQRMLDDARGGLFMTAFYGILDLAVGTLTYCNAGHPPPVLLRASDPGTVQELVRTGMALGAVEEQAWKQATVSLAAGDVLLLYTDGVTDAHNQEQVRFGKQRLLDVLRANVGKPALEVQDRFIAAVRDFVGDSPQFDDLALVVVRREELVPEAAPRERPWAASRSV